MGSRNRYLVNCFILCIPVLAWNFLLANSLPDAFKEEIFWKEIPVIITYGEHLFRALFFLVIFLMPLDKNMHRQKRAGWLLYGVGLCAYFLSWLTLIYYPESSWAKSLPGFTAPAWTPAIWMTGMSYISNRFSFDIPFRRWIVISFFIMFLLFHNLHTYIVFLRLH